MQTVGDNEIVTAIVVDVGDPEGRETVASGVVRFGSPGAIRQGVHDEEAIVVVRVEGREDKIGETVAVKITGGQSFRGAIEGAGEDGGRESAVALAVETQTAEDDELTLYVPVPYWTSTARSGLPS